jgi:hypothetical protein
MYGKIVVSMLLALAYTLPAVPRRSTRFRVLADGWERGKTDARELVIRDASSLHTVWDELHARSAQLPFSGTAAPNVDFTTHIVVLIRMETQSHMESRVAVKRVVRERAHMGQNAQTAITVEESQLETGCVMLALLQPVTPFTLIEVEGTQEVVFRHVKKAIPCSTYIPLRPTNQE